MTCLMAISDEVLREPVSSPRSLPEKPEMLVWFLNSPGLPLSVVAPAMKQVRPKLSIVILSDRPQLSDEELQTVDAIATGSSEAPYFLPMLIPFLSSNIGPVPFLPANSALKFQNEVGHHPPRVLEDLKATVDSLSPTVRRQVIAEFRIVLAETDAA
jgi:hypothetical protein